MKNNVKKLPATNENPIDELVLKLLEKSDPELSSIFPDYKERLEGLTYKILNWLVTKMESPYLNHIIICAFAINDKRAQGIYMLLGRLLSFLNWAIPCHYPDLTSLNPANAIEKLFKSSETGLEGVTAQKAYLGTQFHVEYFLDQLTENQQTRLIPYILPKLVQLRRIMKLRSNVEAQRRTKRKTVVHATVEKSIELMFLAYSRIDFLKRLERVLEEIKPMIQSGKLLLPHDITIKSIDQSEIWTFRVWNRANWISQHKDKYYQNINWYIHQVEYFDTNELFLQFIGEIPKNGWFLEAVSIGVLQGSNINNPKIKEFLKRQNIPQGLFRHNCKSGILHQKKSTAKRLVKMFDSASGDKNDPPALFTVKELLNAAILGLFAYITMDSTSMRMGELQQVSMDEECMKKGFLGAYDDKNEQWEKGDVHTVWYLYPKNEDKERKRYRINKRIIQCLYEWLQVYKKHHGSNLELVSALFSEDAFSHSRKYPDTYRFVLQWEGKQIPSETINVCITFLFMDHIVLDSTGKPFRITGHIFRHVSLTKDAQAGATIDELMEKAKHIDERATFYYSQPPYDLNYQEIGPLLTELGNSVDMDIDLTAIRSLPDIQQILFQIIKTCGVVRKLPGGICGKYETCPVQFRCASCYHYLPEPARDHEVKELIEVEKQNKKNYESEKLYLLAHQEDQIIHDWEHVLAEMEISKNIISIEIPKDFPEAHFDNPDDTDKDDLFFLKDD